MRLFERAYENNLWDVYKMFPAFQDSLWNQLIAYMEIVLLYSIFCYRNSLYISTYMISVYAIYI